MWSFVEVVQWACVLYKLGQEGKPGFYTTMTDPKKVKMKAEEYGMTMRAVANEMFRIGKDAKALLDAVSEEAHTCPS